MREHFGDVAGQISHEVNLVRGLLNKLPARLFHHPPPRSRRQPPPPVGGDHHDRAIREKRPGAIREIGVPGLVSHSRDDACFLNGFENLEADLEMKDDRFFHEERNPAPAELKFGLAVRKGGDTDIAGIESFRIEHPSDVREWLRINFHGGGA
jgi:hypothetical protein